ncbi:UPF0187-domain-containing protein [Phellopilus nigrolimitatus]|nr:UPF0187-domain-containing protein [Phellopilus nigrolimitatus]
MVQKSPLFAKWTVKQFQATVINDIWPETLFFTLVATMVTLVSEKTSHSLAISNQMLTVLGTILGLVVSFRTSSAYDRYWEGRKLWSNINLVSRNLGHLIWIHVPNDRPDKSKAKSEPRAGSESTENVILVENGQTRLKSMIEKKSMINLVQAFSVAVKHALRGEAGIYYSDLYPLVSFLPVYASQPPDINHKTDILPLWVASNFDVPRNVSIPASNSTSAPGTLSRTTSVPGDSKEKEAARYGLERNPVPELHRNADRLGNRRRSDTISPGTLLPTVYCDRKLAPARNPPKTTLYNYIPIFLVFKPIISLVKRLYRLLRQKRYANRPTVAQTDGRNSLGRKRKPVIIESSVPLEITLFLSSYIAWLMQKELVQAGIASSLTAAIISLQDTMASLDRIRTTPIPFAYQAHLRMSMWIYLFLMPFEIYDSFKYLTIPATAFGSFLLLGFMEIGQEIEDPFGYDSNDLDLDQFCLVIERELAEITAHPCRDPHSFLFESMNVPFAPDDQRTAKEMLEQIDHPYHGHDTGILNIRRTLLGNWRNISDRTVQNNF